MSSGKSIPYHLRPNKAVERGLFIQSLRKINKFFDISEYQYIGFGAAFLEDFKMLHHELKICDMISIESDKNTWKRQQFNKPISCINFQKKEQTSSEFISYYNFDKPSIVWLDFVSFNDMYAQLSDVSNLLTKLSDGDIFKITLNANSSNLGTVEEKAGLLDYRCTKFKDLVTQDYAPQGITATDMASKEFPKTLLRVLDRAVSKGIMSAPSLSVVPISTFVYEDGQKMLTVMGVVLDRNKINDFYEITNLTSWPYFSKAWSNPKNISLPVLSARERLFVEQLLPGVSGKDVEQALDFYIGEKNSSEEQMDNFISYYHSFPWFGKLSI